MDDILIIGCGDIGRRVAALYRQHHRRVYALTRSESTARILVARHIDPYVGDLDQPEQLPELPSKDNLVFYFVPPTTQGEGDPRLSTFLNLISGDKLPRKLVYISTSGVYGDRRGAWVTEDDPPKPATSRAHHRLAAESLLRDWETHNRVPVVILRVGGIYGPGRLPAERIRQGTPVLRERECGFTNRIHADDLATICVAAAERGHGIYNVSDGHPTTMTDYFNKVADRYRLPRPPQLGLDEAQQRLSAEMMSYLRESRRLDNGKMLRELGVTLRYPTLEQGLAAIDID